MFTDFITLSGWWLNLLPPYCYETECWASMISPQDGRCFFAKPIMFKKSAKIFLFQLT